MALNDNNYEETSNNDHRGIVPTVNYDENHVGIKSKKSILGHGLKCYF